ncbi:alpha/beta hydrolase [Haloechinothrix sp. YIM 98757]|uniref:Alpha/beta hydrolase n=1 Tax=Haloechinothrix aidingensis TaxID=2752311 RepID=A0A838AF63_9PSEU|nr:alpha/beta hydrolase [Haloechinothrix aidingensis]MBA0127966.1 alpha/beta hydrolase [Haloechinothrix aidingensis]
MSTSPSRGRARPVPSAPLPANTVLPPLDRSLPPWPGEVETAGGARLFVRCTGEAPTGYGGRNGHNVLYVHGLGGSSTNWTDLGYQLMPWGNGIAVDLPGFGFTEPDAGFDFRMGSQAERLAAYLDGHGDAPVHLVGNSMGGAIAILLAARRPDLVRTLTLVSPAMPDLRPDPRRLSDPKAALTPLPLIGKRVRRELAALGPRERARRIIELCCADPDTFPRNRLDELAEEHTARMRYAWAGPALSRSTAELVRTWLAPGAGSLWVAAREVTVPTLVVWGTRDRVISARKALRTVRALPNGRLLLLDRTGHVAQMEHPAALAGAMLGMWQAVRDGRW